MKNLIKRLLKSTAFRVARYPRVKYFLLRLLNRFPRIKTRLYRIALGGNSAYDKEVNIPTEAHLTPRARQIHADLKAAIANRQKEPR